MPWKNKTYNNHVVISKYFCKPAEFEALRGPKNPVFRPY